MGCPRLLIETLPLPVPLERPVLVWLPVWLERPVMFDLLVPVPVPVPVLDAEAEAVEGEAETVVETDIKAEETEEPRAPTSKEDDDFARLMSKVTINNS